MASTNRGRCTFFSDQSSSNSLNNFRPPSLIYFFFRTSFLKLLPLDDHSSGNKFTRLTERTLWPVSHWKQKQWNKDETRREAGRRFFFNNSLDPFISQNRKFDERRKERFVGLRNINLLRIEWKDLENICFDVISYAFFYMNVKNLRCRVNG